MFAKQFAVCAVLLIAFPAAADDELPNSSPNTARLATDFVKPVSLNEPPEPTVASVVGPIDAPQQVQAHLQVVEINMTKLRKMGVDFSTSRADGLRSLYCDSALLEFLKWLEQNNFAKVLADPTVMCMSGRQALFHIGGDFPEPAGPNSTSTVDFRRYGTEVNLLAKVLQSGDMNLDVKLRVSQLDEGRSATIAGTQVPAVTSRELCTNVTVPDHQLVVLSGQNQERVESFVKDGHVQEETIEIRTLTTVTAEIVPPIVRK